MVPRLFIPGKFYSFNGVGCLIQRPNQFLQMYQLKNTNVMMVKSDSYKIDARGQ